MEGMQMKKMTLEEAVKTNEFEEIYSKLMDDGAVESDYRGARFVIMPGWDELNKFVDSVNELLVDDERTTPLEQILVAYLGEEADWGFYDEYDTCGNCYEVVRTSPTSYHWKPDFVRHPEYGEITCEKCLLADPEWYINDVLINNHNAANTVIDTAVFRDMGFERFYDVRGNCDFETGWHRGQIYRPEKILKEAHERGYTEVVFNIVSNSLFYTTWEAWVRGKEDEEEGNDEEDICSNI
jgi:hypothetical protein